VIERKMEKKEWKVNKKIIVYLLVCQKMIFFLFFLRKVRNELKLKELKIGKWTRLVRITEIKFGDNFRSMTKFIS
jgi:hypothetical protein